VETTAATKVLVSLCVPVVPLLGMTSCREYMPSILAIQAQVWCLLFATKRMSRTLRYNMPNVEYEYWPRSGKEIPDARLGAP
jgi:hypothetical protein